MIRSLCKTSFFIILSLSKDLKLNDYQSYRFFDLAQNDSLDIVLQRLQLFIVKNNSYAANVS